MNESREPALQDPHPRILDWRARQTLKNSMDACEMRGSAIVMRKPEDIVAITLHQTGCWYDVAPYQLKAAKGDEATARHTRFLGVNAHMTSGRHGKAVLAYNPLAYVNHGHQLNPFSVGKEHEGLYDQDGNPIGLPSGVKVDEIIEAGRAGVAYLVETLPNIKLLYAHRQAMRAKKGARAKTADPGKRIFRDVGLWAVKKYGLTIDPEKVFGVGKPLPPEWYL